MKNKLSLLAAPLALSCGVQAASVSLNFTDIDLNSGAVIGGSVGRATTNEGTPQQKHTVFTVTGLDLNDDDVNDTFKFTLQVSGGTNAVNVKGSGVNQSYTIGAGNIESGESITFAVSGATFISGDGGTGATPTMTFNGFTNLNTLFGQNGGETFNINGGSPITLSTSPQDIALGGLTSFTVNALDTVGASATSFRARDLDLGFTFDTISAAPEPSSTALLGIGGVALLLRRRK